MVPRHTLVPIGISVFFIMDKAYNHKLAEQKWYKFWEESGFFKPEINSQGEPFTIILPPPNASGKMHTGNVLMIAIEDLLIRWHRMKGDAALWIPGTDHAGTETQITFERELRKQNKSRFNFNREGLYQEIWEFVQNNKHRIENQIRQMGASVDWDRYKFTLDPAVVTTVHQTFKKMAGDGLVYRGEYMVNYCPKCGTTYADVEIFHEERKDPLYYIKYKLIDGGEFICVATVRPEPIWADTHLAVNPKDKKLSFLVGKRVLNPLTGFEMVIIADEFVDPKFGTGIVKLTPAVDKNDYEVALKHNLPINPVLDWEGRLKGYYQGLSVPDARQKAVKELTDKGLLEKTDQTYSHTVALCKAGHDIEPTIIPNWFIKVDAPEKSFKQPAYDVVRNGQVKIYPKWREKTYLKWMEEMRDWPVSRQNVWGIQIPVFYQVDQASQFYVWFVDQSGNYQHGRLDQIFDQGYKLTEVVSGLQRVASQPEVRWVFEEDKDPDKDYLPETDTFDTWFSSGQWPLVTLGYPNSKDYQKFYPTQVLETGWDIIRLWVSRMIMFGIYLDPKHRQPFQAVYLHGIVKALDGKKMSKSLGNVINPDDYIEEFGVDALRMGLISGTANGKDFAFPKDRVIAFKHFANKIWNMARFMLLMIDDLPKELPDFSALDKTDLNNADQEIINGLNKLIKTVESNLEKFRFADAGEAIYQFMWHEIADKYIEQIKTREDKAVALSVLNHVYTACLKLLHPFMPFVTEEIYQNLPHHTKSLMIEKWPQRYVR